MKPHWFKAAQNFVKSLHDEDTGGYRSVPGGPVTLYGTCYGLLARHFLGGNIEISAATRSFIQSGQEEATGWFAGPELRNFQALPGARHDREHLLMHLTCAVLPLCQQYGIHVLRPLVAAERFCDLDFLRSWLDRRDLRYAWFEGNNLLFAGQLLVYLRDAANERRAQPALDAWFDWLEAHVDPRTSLWGTDGSCSSEEAVYGGYHQLLVYYHEQRDLQNPRGLVDTVLGLQHRDGGFHPRGNAGACEDVDSVDILVNAYKQADYRRRDIRLALRKCLRHILGQQNRDGGFPYTRDRSQSHMNIPGTGAPANVSTMFPTWFRIHTLALIAEVVPDERSLAGISFRFSEHLSMGWHRAWDKSAHALSAAEMRGERAKLRRWQLDRAALRTKDALWDFAQRICRAGGRMP